MFFSAISFIPSISFYPTNERKALYWKIAEIVTGVALAALSYSLLFATPTAYIIPTFIGTQSVAFILWNSLFHFFEEKVEFYQDEAGIDLHVPKAGSRKSAGESYFAEQIDLKKGALKQIEDSLDELSPDEKASRLITAYTLSISLAKYKLKKLLLESCENPPPLKQIVQFCNYSQQHYHLDRTPGQQQFRFVIIQGQSFTLNQVLQEDTTDILQALKSGQPG